MKRARKQMTRSLAVSLAVCLFAAAACAQDAPNYNGFQRFCQPEDLVPHVFLLVDFHETPVTRRTHWMSRFRYAYMRFMQGNYYNDIASNRPAKDVQQIQKVLNRTPGQFSLSKDGVLSLIKDDKIRHTYRCIAVLKPYAEYIKGDIILTGYTRKRKSELYELYRLWY